MPSEARHPRLAAVPIVADIQTCFSCPATEGQLATVTANYHRLRAEIERLTGERDRALAGLRRDSHVLDPAEPHRRRV